MSAFDEDWIARFFEIADSFAPCYGGKYTVRPSYSHVECVHETQVGISMRVPEGGKASEYAAEINRRLKERQ